VDPAHDREHILPPSVAKRLASSRTVAKAPSSASLQSDEKTSHGGNYATPHPEFNRDTVLKQTRAPDRGALDSFSIRKTGMNRRGFLGASAGLLAAVPAMRAQADPPASVHAAPPAGAPKGKFKLKYKL
jgi:hypothetical protein